MIVAHATLAQTLGQGGIMNPIDAPFLGIRNFRALKVDPRLLPANGGLPLPTPGALPPPDPVVSQARITHTESGDILEVQLENQTEWIHLGDLIDVPIGTKIYTWAPIDDATRWDQQNLVDDGEMKWLVENGAGVAGGGFYASFSPTDSQNFGEILIEQKITKPVRMLESSRQLRWSAKELLKLRDAGIEVIRYSQTWMNWIRNSDQALGEARRISTLAEVLPVIQEIRKTRPDLVHNDYQNVVAVVIRLTANRDPAQISYMKEFENLGFKKSYFDQGLKLPERGVERGDPAHVFRLIEEFRPYFVPEVQKLAALIKEGFSLPLKKETLQKLVTRRFDFQNPPPPFAYLTSRTGLPGWTEFRLLQNAGYSVSDLLGESVTPAIKWVYSIPTDLSLTAGASAPTSYMQSLALGASFIDLPDYLLAMADGNPAPWTLYDANSKAPLIDRWQKAVATLRPDMSLIQSPTPPTPAVAVDQLLQVAKIISDESVTSIRTRDIWAGGDLQPDTHGGYYRVSASELAVLQGNPFITVETKPDPFSRTGQPTALARHRYTSLQDYARFSDFLEPALFSEIQEAEKNGLFKTFEAPAYGVLTQRFLRSLISAVISDSNELAGINSLQLATLYRFLISIHPFDDFNGRSIRAFLNGVTYTNILLADWNHDLTAPLLSLSQEIENGTNAFMFLMPALYREREKNLIFPRFFDIPEWYQMLTQTGKLAGDPEPFVRTIKQYLQTSGTRELIRQKRFNELRYPSSCDQNLWPLQK